MKKRQKMQSPRTSLLFDERLTVLNIQKSPAGLKFVCHNNIGVSHTLASALAPEGDVMSSSSLASGVFLLKRALSTYFPV